MGLRIVYLTPPYSQDRHAGAAGSRDNLQIADNHQGCS
jgi:hypothetical protein